MRLPSRHLKAICLAIPALAGALACKPDAQSREQHGGKSIVGGRSSAEATGASGDGSAQGTGTETGNPPVTGTITDGTGPATGSGVTTTATTTTADATSTATGTQGGFTQTVDAAGAKGPGAFANDFRSSAAFFTRMSGLTTGNSPHGKVRIWYSANLKDLLDRPSFTAPEGSVAIKVFVNATSSGHVVMIKKAPGFDPANNDWHFEVRDESGQLLADPPAGKNATCSACHAAAAAKDYLAGTALRGDPPIAGGKPGTPPPADPAAPAGPGAFVTDFAANKGFFTDMTAARLGKSPHGRVRVWYSSNIRHLLGNATFTAPTGTVAIKEFDNDGQPGVDGVAVMVKKAAGYDTAHGDWYFEMRDRWGTLLSDPAPGRIASCAACHAAASATDLLAATKLGDSGGGGAGPGAFKADYATSPAFFTEMSAMAKGQGAHGDVRIWYSANLRSAIGTGTVTAPNGSVAIARYAKDQEAGLVVMIKEDGFDAANGNWRYEYRDRYGNLKWNPRPGAVPECIACHKNKPVTDRLQGTMMQN